MVGIAGNNNLLADCSFLWLSMGYAFGRMQLMKRIFVLDLLLLTSVSVYVCVCVQFDFPFFSVHFLAIYPLLTEAICVRLTHSVSLFSIRINLKWKNCYLSAVDL